MTLLLHTFLFLSALFGADACNGYKLHVRRFTNCGENNVMVLHNFNVSLSKDCIVIPSGCIETFKDVTSATVKYTVTRNMAPISGVKDGCSTLDSANSEAEQILKLFGVPTKCPIKKGKVCNDKHKQVDVSKYRHKLALLLGDIQTTVKIDSDAGHSCLQFEGSIMKNLLPRIPIMG